ncbi:MAG: LysR family transcriptional regulator, partial [Lachnospiraceae bacterium]|nr:LysR family transcriptional regulator [Lachnospiraceae bacterium]
MTLQQLRYIVTVAQTGNITEAAKRLFISQPSLTNAIHELEKEMQITIFNRTNKGVSLSNDGEIFLSYARQVLEQTDLLEEKFLNKKEQSPK